MSPTVVESPVISTKPVIASGSKSSEPKSPVSSPLRFKQSPDSQDDDRKERPQSPVRPPPILKDDDTPKKREPSPEKEKVPEPSQESTSKLPLIDMETFEQILELDEEPDYEFMQQMVEAYYEQAADTFEKMDVAFKKKDLADLASLGHFLKGSSAALGLSRVQAICETIQHIGLKRDEDNNRDLSSSEALSIIGGLLERVKAENVEAEAWLKKWCDDHLA